MSESGFTFKHNARRAARRAGLDVAALEFFERDGRWFWREKGAAAAEPAAASEASCEEDAGAVVGCGLAAVREPAAAKAERGDAGQTATRPDAEFRALDAAEGSVAEGAADGAAEPAPVLEDSREDAYFRETGQRAAHDVPRLEDLRTVLLEGVDGADYGPIAASEAREMARQLAECDRVGVRLVDPDSRRIIETIEPEGEPVDAEDQGAAAPAAAEAPAAAPEVPVLPGVGLGGGPLVPVPAPAAPEAEAAPAPAAEAVPAGAPGAGDEPRSPEALVAAAREQAAVFERSGNGEVAWLLRALADAVEGKRPGRARTAAPPRASGGGERRPRGASAGPWDPNVKPVIKSPTNQGVQKLIDRIAAARGDLAALRQFRFARSSTYYALAGRYLDALIAEAEAAGAGAGDGAAPPEASVGAAAGGAA